MILINPQWQGAGEPNGIPESVARIRETYFPEYGCCPGLLAEPSPAANGIRHDSALLANLGAAGAFVTSRRPDKIFLVGGECSTELVPVRYLNALYGGLRVLWFDAHADLNTGKTSPSMNLHGMPLRLLLGEGDAGFLAGMPAGNLRPDRVILAGVRDIDPPEREFISANAIRTVPAAGIAADPRVLRGGLGRSPAYVHIDLDVLDPEFFPRTVCPTPGGISMEELLAAVREVARTDDIVGMSIVEYRDVDGKGTGELGELIGLGKALVGTG